MARNKIRKHTVNQGTNQCYTIRTLKTREFKLGCEVCNDTSRRKKQTIVLRYVWTKNCVDYVKDIYTNIITKKDFLYFCIFYVLR